MEIFIVEEPHDASARGRAVSVEEGESLLAALQRAGVPMQAPCGGAGTCGKCSVDVSRGGGPWMRVLACQTDAEEGMRVRPFVPEGGLHVESSDADAGALARFRRDAAEAGELGVAVDLGTTTIAVYLFDASNARLLARGGAPNPQASFGADVISRINALSLIHI